MRISRVSPGDDSAIAQAGELFDRYRIHYGHPSSPAHSTHRLRGHLECEKLLAYLAFPLSGDPVGLATVTPVPASLLLRGAWQIRDRYVLPDSRRQGVAASLIEHVTAAAAAGGAVRVSLQTELDNGALRLYHALGFATVDGLRLLYRPLMSDPPATM